MRWAILALACCALSSCIPEARAQDLGDQTLMRGGMSPQAIGDGFGRPTATGPVCGNGVIDDGEVCDGADLDSETCVSQGQRSGTLSCAGDCASFDTSACCGEPPQTSLAVWLDAADVDGDDVLNEELNGAAVTTWVSKGGYTDHPTQGSAGAKPTVVTNCLATSRPCVRFDGGDVLMSSTASNSTFLHNGSKWTSYVVVKQSLSNPNTIVALVTNVSACGSSSARGTCISIDDSSAASREDRANLYLSTGSSLILNVQSSNDAAQAEQWHSLVYKLDDNGGAGNDGFVYADGSSVGAAAVGGAYSASDSSVLSIGATATPDRPLTGDIAQVLIYSGAAHDDTERGAVEDWIACEYPGAITFP